MLPGKKKLRYLQSCGVAQGVVVLDRDCYAPGAVWTCDDTAMSERVPCVMQQRTSNKSTMNS